MADDGLSSPTSTTADLLDYQSKDFSPSQIASVKCILENHKQALLEQSTAFRSQVEQALQRTQLLQHDIGTLSEFALRTSHAVALVEATEMNVQNTMRREESELRDRFEVEKAGLLRKIEEASHQSELFRHDLQAMRQRAKEDREEFFALQDINRELTARITARETELSTKLKNIEDLKEQALRREADLQSEICKLKEKLNSLAKNKSRRSVPIDFCTDDPNRVIQVLTDQYEELQQNYLELKEEYRCAQLEWWAREEAGAEVGEEQSVTKSLSLSISGTPSMTVLSPPRDESEDGAKTQPQGNLQADHGIKVQESEASSKEVTNLLTNLQKENTSLQAQIQTIMDANNNLTTRLSEAETRITTLTAEKDTFHTNLVQSKEKLSSLEEKCAVVQNKLEIREAEYCDLKDCLDKDFCHVMDQLAASYNSVTAHGLQQSFVIPPNIPAAEQVVRLKKTVLTLNARLNDEREKLKIVNKRLEDKQVEIKGLEAQMTKIESEWKAEYDMYLGTLHVEKQRRARVEETLQRLETELEQSRREVTSQKAHILKLRADVSATNVGMNKLNAELQETRTKLKEALSAAAAPPKGNDCSLSPDSGRTVTVSTLWDLRSSSGANSTLLALVVLLVASLVVLGPWIKIA